jgi:hypothetical protein
MEKELAEQKKANADLHRTLKHKVPPPRLASLCARVVCAPMLTLSVCACACRSKRSRSWGTRSRSTRRRWCSCGGT